MQRKAERKCRGGAIVPLVAVALVGVLGMVALAIDLTLVMIARNQAQAAADAAALAGARTLNSDTAHSNNSSGAKTNAQNVAQTNSILGQPITAGQVATVNIGDYWYDYTNNKFQITTNGLGLSGDNYNLCQVTVNFNTGQSFFSAVFGMNGFNTGATATAVHRPRDVVIVQDFSSSMRLDSMMGMPKNASITQSMLPLSGNDGGERSVSPVRPVFQQGPRPVQRQRLPAHRSSLGLLRQRHGRAVQPGEPGHGHLGWASHRQLLLCRHDGPGQQYAGLRGGPHQFRHHTRRRSVDVLEQEHLGNLCHHGQ